MKRAIPVKTKLAARTIGEQLSTWRRMTGFTSQEIADKAGVSRGTVSRLENGDPSVSLATFLNVVRVYDLLDSVVDATDPMSTDLGRARAEMHLPQRVRSAR